jgi:hypothetical protein
MGVAVQRHDGPSRMVAAGAVSSLAEVAERKARRKAQAGGGHGRALGRRSHSCGGLSDRPWIVIVVVDDARAMTFGTGDDVAVLILNPAPAMALRTDFHAACPVPSRQHRIFETPVPHRQSRLRARRHRESYQVLSNPTGAAE